MEQIKGGVTAPKGFLATGLCAGIKKENKKDMALIYSKEPCIAAGTFTTNKVKAAPVQWDMDIVKNSKAVHAIVINSGVANACTGKQGLDYCQESADTAAAELHISADAVTVASTGVIGKQLPMDLLKKGIQKMVPQLGNTYEDSLTAAESIMTTDTAPKQTAVTVEIGGKTVTVAGMAKGSGMIHPNMCTMLSFLTTDAVISKEMLQAVLSDDIQDTYNMISVDGDTSTNDTVLMLANGLAENPEIHEKNEAYEIFKEAVHEINLFLAKKIAGDGEGATALFGVHVIHADTKEQARLISKSVVSSCLTKTAIFGHDANWGRILCAMGYSGADFDPEQVDLYFESAAGKILIAQNGMAVNYSEDEATKILSESEVTAIADLNAGQEECCAWGCDLSYDYIKINADYRS